MIVMGAPRSHNWLQTIASSLVKTAFFLGCYVCLSGMLTLLALDPIMRYLVGKPFFWSNEATTYLMIIMVFNGFAIALVNDKHVRITLIFDHLGRKTQDVLWIIICLITLSYGSFLACTMILLALSSLQYGVISPTAELPMFPWQSAAAWGLIAFSIATIMVMARKISDSSKRGKEIEAQIYGVNDASKEEAK